MNLEIKKRLASKPLAFLAAGVLVAPILAGCGSGKSGANMAPVDDSSRAQTMTPAGNYGGYNGYSQPAPHQGLSTKQKVVLLAGAAALYYMYKKNQQKRAQGDTSQPQYYLSKNGRVYYRDSTGRAHWVTPPQGGIQVPYGEAQQYSQYQGYNGQSNGQDLNGLGSDTAPAGMGGY